MAQIYESVNDVYSMLPVKIYKHNLTGDFINVPLHWHRSLEITVTLTGTIRFNTGSNNFDFVESDWIIVNSGELHSCRYINPTDYFSGISMIISLPFIEKWMGTNLFFYNPEIPQVTEMIKNISVQLFALDPEDTNYSLILMSKVYEILYIIAQNCIKADVEYSTPLDKKLKMSTILMDYIDCHYQENISLNSVAEHFKYSASYLSRLFKESLGVNFHSYLNMVRVSHAAEQLLIGNISITQCAYNNGFPNTKSFISTFKKLYGCTPSNFVVKSE